MLHGAAVLGRTARMGDYDVRNANPDRRAGILAAGISADPSADQGAHCRPWTPASLSPFRRFGLYENWALTRRRLWATPLAPLHLPPNSSISVMMSPFPAPAHSNVPFSGAELRGGGFRGRNFGTSANKQPQVSLSSHIRFFNLACSAFAAANPISASSSRATEGH